METFVGYFFFWFYFALVLVGQQLCVVAGIFGGLAAYDAHTDRDTFVMLGGSCVVIVSVCSIIGLMVLTKFVLNPIWISLPPL